MPFWVLGAGCWTLEFYCELAGDEVSIIDVSLIPNLWIKKRTPLGSLCVYGPPAGLLNLP